jgi:hypothetical protein
MKNSEWGAAAYLAHSEYGRNGTKVRINNSNGSYTGWGASTDNEGSITYNASSVDNLWTGKYGMLASTTGNVYGIYDMSGGAWEQLAAYLDNGHSNLDNYAASLKGGAAKYKNVYEAGLLDNKRNNYAKTSKRMGEAIYETSLNGNDANAGWNNERSYFPENDLPTLGRGSNYSMGTLAGLFAFSIAEGNMRRR